MFIVEAIADFSSSIMNEPVEQANQQQNNDNNETQKQEKVEKQDGEQDELKSKKRGRTKQQTQQLQERSQQDEPNKKEDKKEQQSEGIKYTSFKEGDKILVKQTFQNGWWLGHPVGKTDLEGFFPSTFVKIGIKPPAPPSAPKKQKKQEQIPAFDPSQGTDWIKNELDQIKTGPIKSDYYQGIKGYKMVKIDEKNQNILKGNHVQFDVATGLAKVPVKDQAPAAKAVRQMGYYFDYHQWNEHRNHNPEKKSRPDPKKKKAKRLHLKMMD